MNFPTLLVGQANPERDAQLAEAMAAYRAYPGTLKKLEVPGWVLTDGTQRCTIADLQQAMRSGGKSPESRSARLQARERLGMEA